MPNRARNYMDRIFGRNEGSESRDFTNGRRYGEEQRFYDDESFENRRNRGDYERNHRTQASRTRQRPGQYKSDSDRDYNVRHFNEEDQNAFWDDNFYSERERGFSRRDDYQGDSFAPGDFRNARASGPRGGFFGKGPKGWKWSDDRIKDQVSEALYRDYNVDASEIEVEVKDGVVTLTGSVDSREAKRAAEECIENLSGVVDVHNRIRIADRSNVSNIRNEKDSGTRPFS